MERLNTKERTHMQPITSEAYQLFHKASLVFTDMEENGVRIDTKYMKAALHSVTAKIDRLSDRLKRMEVYKIWRRESGTKINIDSRRQLAHVLFDVMKYPVTHRTKTGLAQVNEESLKEIDLPFITTLLRVEKYKKLRSTYLRGILKEVNYDGFLHPHFNLHTTKTYRSSSSNPNFQNIPVRNAEIGKIIRQGFIPRDGYYLTESDFSGIEVCVAACYNKDPRLIQYIIDPTTDMHRDMAAQIFMIKPEQVTKLIRYWGKSGFVFAEFYGDYYISCAKRMWKELIKGNFITADGINVKDHLAKQGITRLGRCDPKQTPQTGTFEKHMKEVEDDFWNNRFKIYARWKKQWWSAYERDGEFMTKTGFRIAGIYNRKEVTNYPIQGSAFHCLLWTLIELSAWLKRRKMKTKIIGQIHDSVLADVHKDELDDYIVMIKRIASKKLPRAWKWINVPLTIDVEVAPLGRSWHEKTEI